MFSHDIYVLNGKTTGAVSKLVIQKDSRYPMKNMLSPLGQIGFGRVKCTLYNFMYDLVMKKKAM